MGSQMAPCYANIVMHYLETQWLRDNKSKVVLYQRYLDDIFIVFDGTKEQATQSLQTFNKLHPNIQISSEISVQSANFLDLTIFKGPSFVASKIFDVKTYSKPFSSFLYLPYHSFHTASIKRAFIKGEAIRFLRNSSSLQYFLESIHQLKKQLLKRRYPSKFIDQALASIGYHLRPQYLQKKSKEQSQNQINLKLPYTLAPLVQLSPLVDFCKNTMQCKLNITWIPPPPVGRRLVASTFRS